MNVRSQLVQYARQIAQYRGYDNLMNGLQPVAVLIEKFEAEKQEFNEAVEKKSPLHVLHEAADMLYYGACLGEQSVPHDLWYLAVSRFIESYDVSI